MNPAIRLIGFSGEQPRLSPRLLPPTGATATLDARLDNGALSPYRAPAAVLGLVGAGPFDTIYRFNDAWLAFTGTVNLAPGPVAEDRLYYTGDGVPKVQIGATVYPLKVPRPSVAPTAATGGTGSGDVFTRTYVYTFVTSFGEESEPSAASNEVDWQSGQTVTLSGVENAPVSPARGITKQRFYRSQSGSVGTDFYFIAERAVSNANFVDNVAVDAFAEPLPSRHYTAPPDGLTGLIPLPNGMMAGFVGRTLYFCEPFVPHAWPEIYTQLTDTPIVALAAFGTTVLVLTEGNPYYVTGSSPDAMVMEKVESNYPCINARGVIDLGYAVAYPSVEGLAVARPGGAVSLVTTNIFSPQDWQRLNPRAMHASQLSGRWIGSYTAADENGQDISGSLIIDLSANSFLIRASARGRAWFYDVATGELFFLVDKTIYQFDPSDAAPLSLFWKSKPFVLAKPDNMGVILVEAGDVPTAEAIAARAVEIAAIIATRTSAIAAGPVGGGLADAMFCATTVAGDLLAIVPAALSFEMTVGVIADGVLVASITEVDRVMRLPAGFKARTWQVTALTNSEIAQISIARSVNELKQMAAG